MSKREITLEAYLRGICDRCGEDRDLDAATHMCQDCEQHEYGAYFGDADEIVEDERLV